MKALYALTLSATLLLSACGESKKEDPKPTTPAPAGVAVSVRENNAAAYNLTEARVVSSNYNGVIGNMTMTGKLANGKPLTLVFGSNNNTTVNTTNTLTAYLDGVQASQSTGTTTRNASTNKVSGTFSASFPGLSVTGSFTDVPL